MHRCHIACKQGPWFALMILAGSCLWAGFTQSAVACNRGRAGTGTGGINRQAMMMMQAQQQQMQREQQRMIAQTRAERQALLAKFDSNGDGRISGKERGPAEKLLRDQRLGKAGPLAAPVSEKTSLAGKSSRNKKK